MKQSEDQSKLNKTAHSANNIWNPDGDDNPAIDENNDNVEIGRYMRSMAQSMYQFEEGKGTLKTTQDFFTLLKYFVEEANRLYIVVRQYSLQVSRLILCHLHPKSCFF